MMADELITKQAVLDLAYKGGSLAGLIHAFKVENLNGVNTVVLPCKVGDTMYCDGKYFARHCAGEVMEFSVDRIETTVSNLFRGEVDVQFDFDDFGKTVFLTREEAEKALGERKEDNATD